MTFDEKIFNLKQEMIQSVNRYSLPASVIILICEGIIKDVSPLIQRTNQKEVIDNVNNKETDDSNNTESKEENHSSICRKERHKEDC